jgi:hypothetical protein
VATLSQAYARPAPSGTSTLAAHAVRRSANGTSAAAPSTASAIHSCRPCACPAWRCGAVSARIGAPAATAPTASTSLAPTLSPRRQADRPSTKTRLVPSSGWTTVSGACVSASACSAQPARPSAVPATQRGRRTSRRNSEKRSACADGARRASSACNAIPTA